MLSKRDILRKYFKFTPLRKVRSRGTTIYIGELPRKRRRKKKQKSEKTLSNKLRKLKSFYNRVFKESKKAKEREQKLIQENPELKKKLKNKVYFCDKYPTFDDFLKKQGVKSENS